MLRRNKHFGPRPQIRGRRRLLDPEKKVELCEHVAKGAPVEDAAETVGVSIRTVRLPKSTVAPVPSMPTTRPSPWVSWQTRSPTSNCSITGSGRAANGLLA